ncbi:MAG: MarR family transcriptional regulator [Xanthomonadales bacterium]|nr:MarR family transcriptional regulator [Gammaproteobacteria bacterium]NNL96407.1 MarR family transcriptional regulator [Xanthomonadales bacterium]
MTKPITAKNAAKQDFMPLMRELVRAYQAFASFDARLHRESGFGLTVSQADVIFTLGNTDGLTCSEIGERTLITKGTLTGVIDRLVKKGLVKRSRMNHDARCVQVSLTAKGEKVFGEAFPLQVEALGARFERLDPDVRKQAQATLAALRAIF